MATKFGIRNYSRNGNQVTFTVQALNADGSIDTAYRGSFDFSTPFNLTGVPASYTFAAGDQGQRVFTATITDPNAQVSVAALFPGNNSGANLFIAGPGGTNVTLLLTGDHMIVGNTGNDTLTGNAGNDFMRFDRGGDDIANGNGGNDSFYFGGAYTAADRVDGGAGVDSAALQGNYSGSATLGTILNTELFVLLSGGDTRFGESGANSYDYSLIANASTVVSNNRLNIQANSLRAGEDLTFDGSASAIDCTIYAGAGTDRLTGGSGNDSFFFGQGRFGSSDVINGGAGSVDQIGLQGTFSISFGATQMSGIEYLVLLSTTDTRFGAGGGAARYTLQMNEDNVAAGERLIVQGNTLTATETLQFNGINETNGSFQIFAGAANDVLGGGAGNDDIFGGAGDDIIQGWLGADTFRGGAGNDTFYFSSVQESIASARDEILDFTLGDQINLTGISASLRFIGGNAQTGANQVQVLQNGKAATVNLYLDADAVADLVIDLTVADGHTVTSADFFALQPPETPTGKSLGAMDGFEPGAAMQGGDYGSMLDGFRQVHFAHWTATHDLLL